jgi:polysaccharide export outer membrane protein
MFKTGANYPYSPSDSTLSKEYVIRPGDELTIQILSNNGYQLVDVVGQSAAFSPEVYTIKSEGFAILPLLDSVYLAGYTITSAENFLSTKYSYYFVNPYINIKISNRRCVVFNGKSLGKVVQLAHENMSLIEVLALAGGPEGSKAYKIKIIRGDLSNPKVILIDLSTMDGVKKSNLQVDANDIIYVEPVYPIITITNDVFQYTSIITTLILLYTTLKNLNQL